MKCKEMPPLTALQYMFVSHMPMAGEISGPDLRADLRGCGISSDGPKFYQMMDRIEQGGWAKCRSVLADVGNGQANHVRFYRLTPSGAKAILDTREFYAPIT